MLITSVDAVYFYAVNRNEIVHSYDWLSLTYTLGCVCVLP